MEKKYGIIILAAGGSSRLGSPKQLLPFRHKTLLKHVVSAAMNIGEAIVVVVTGAHKEEIEKSISDTNVAVVHNSEWQSGMASSVRAGLGWLLEQPEPPKSCIITVCDQPYISSDVFRSLISAYELEHKGICASSYGDTAGTPVLFSHTYFAELMTLKGDEGAKKLLSKNAKNLTLVPFFRGEIDVDTREDYEKIA